MNRHDPPAGLSTWKRNYSQVTTMASYPGNFFIDTSRDTYTFAGQLSAGITALLTNDGMTPQDYESNYSDLPVQSRAKILNANELRARGKHWNQYTDTDTDALAQAIAVKPAKYVLSEMGEAEADFARVYDSNPTQFVRLDKALAAQYPGTYSSEYAGATNEYQGLTSGNRAALQSDANALAYMKTPKGQGGGLYNLMPYFLMEAYKWGQMVIINLYHNGSWNGQFLLRFMLSMCIARMATRAAGYPTIHLMGMTEGLDNETGIGAPPTGFSCVYVRKLPNGGRVKAHHGFTPTSFDQLACAHFLGGMIGRASHLFAPRTFFGDDEMAIGPLLTDPNSAQYFDYDSSGASGSQPDQSATFNGYYKIQPGVKYAFPRHPRGAENGCHWGHDLSQQAKLYVGNEDWYFPAVTRYNSDGSSTAYTAGPGSTMIATCYDNALPQALYGKGTNGKRWLWAMYQARDGQPETIRVKFGMDGVDSDIVTLTSGIFNFWTD